jgi:UDP:flavonoid glycosyltransferase YjiC (YdhE family)
MNSVSEALYCGVPLVLFPQTAEQKGVANRTSELGAGVMLESADKTGIRTAINAVLSDSKYREAAAKIRASFRSCGGPQEAAEFIISVAHS